MVTTVTQDGDYAVINGVKRFISAAAYEGPIVVFCKDTEVGGVSAYSRQALSRLFVPSLGKIGGHGSLIYDVYLRCAVRLHLGGKEARDLISCYWE